MWRVEKMKDFAVLDRLDEEFVSLVYKEIDGFLHQKTGPCVLVFPPLNVRRRYLIHKVGELFSLGTFSVGEGEGRLTVVCSPDKLLKSSNLEIPVPTSAHPEPQPGTSGVNVSRQNMASRKSNTTEPRKLRPDAPIYIPPAIRRLQQKQTKVQIARNSSERKEATPKEVKSERTQFESVQSEKSEPKRLNQTSTQLREEHSVDKCRCENKKENSEDQFNWSSEPNVCQISQPNSSVPDNKSVILFSPYEIGEDPSIQGDQLADCHCAINNTTTITELRNGHNRLALEHIEENNVELVKNSANEENINNDFPELLTSETQEELSVLLSIVEERKYSVQSLEREKLLAEGSHEIYNIIVENGIIHEYSSLSRDVEVLLKSKEEYNELPIALGIEENGSLSTETEELSVEVEENGNKSRKKELEKNLTWSDEDNCDQDQEELLRASEEINRKNRKIIKQSFKSSDMLIIDEPELEGANEDIKMTKKNGHAAEASSAVDCWEDLLEEGIVDSDMINEITEHVGRVGVTKAKEDYDDFRTKPAYEGDYSHVLEIYDFPKEFQTRDLISICDSIKCGTYHIKWVDDNHALCVFSSGFAANEVLKASHPLVKFRPFTEASKQSINKVKRYPNAVIPSAVRPQTCPQTARRIVTGALGLKLENAKEERAKEIQILKEARAQKKLNKQQQDDAWEGIPPTSN